MRGRPAAGFACLFGGALASALARLSAGFSTGDGLELRPIGFFLLLPAFVSVSSLRVAGTVAGAGACAAGAAAGASPRPTETAGAGFRTTGVALAGGLVL